MNVLELNFERTWRGGERQTIYNIEGLLQESVTVTLLCRKGFPLEQKAREKDVRVASFRNIPGVIFYLLVNGRKYDVLHAQTSHILTYCLLTRPFHKAKVVFSRRVDFVPKGWLTRLKYRNTDQIVAISEAVKEIVAQFSGRTDIKVASDIVVPIALDPAKARHVLEANGIPGNKIIIGTVAALVPHKDPLTMVAAIKELSDKRSDFLFLHAGAGEMEEAVRQKIAELRLEQVYFPLGFVEDVEHLFSVFDVFVMSSQEEGLGSSVLDAFVYKVSVVGTDAGGLSELLSDGRAIKCAKKDATAIAEGINQVLSNEHLRTSIVQRAYRYVLEKHNLDYITQQYMNVFNRE